MSPGARTLCILSLVAWQVPTARASERPLLVRLAVSPSELHARSVARREARLTRLLEALPEVAQVAVQLELPDPSAEPLDRPLRRPRATVALTLRGEGPGDHALFSLASSVVPELGREALSIHRSAQPPPPNERALVEVGPFAVSAASARPLRAALGASLGMNALLAALLLVRRTSRRGRRGARCVDTSRPHR